MALRLNLRHEIAKQKARNRRDPLKLSMFGLGAVAACFAGYYAVQLGVSHSLNSDLASVQGEYDGLKAKAAAAQKREEELNRSIKLSEALVKRVENRFYWANVLDSVSQAVPREIQITKLAGNIGTDKAKKCTINVEGVSAGAEPRKVAEDLRRALTERFSAKYKNVTAKFESLDDGKDLARLDSQQLPTAIFSINLQMQTGEEEAPPPPPRKAAPAKKSADGGML